MTATKNIAIATLALAAAAAGCKPRQAGSDMRSLSAPGDGTNMQVIQYHAGSKTFQFKKCTNADIANAKTTADGEIMLGVDGCTGAAISEPIPEALYKTLLGRKVGYYDVSEEEERLSLLYHNLDTILNREAAAGSGPGVQGPTQVDVLKESTVTGIGGIQQQANQTAQAVDTAIYLRKDILARLDTAKVSDPAKTVISSLAAKIHALEAIRKKYYQPNLIYNTVLEHLMPRYGRDEKYKTVPSTSFETWQLALIPFEEVRLAGGVKKLTEVQTKYRWSTPTNAAAVTDAIDTCKKSNARLPQAEELIAFYIASLSADDSSRKDYGKDQSGQPARYWIIDSLAMSNDKSSLTAKTLIPATGKIDTHVLVKRDIEDTKRHAAVICIAGAANAGPTDSGSKMFTDMKNAKQAKITAFETDIRNQKAKRDKLQSELQSAKDFLPEAEQIVAEARTARWSNGVATLNDQYQKQVDEATNQTQKLKEGIKTLEKILKDVDQSIAQTEKLLANEKL